MEEGRFFVDRVNKLKFNSLSSLINRLALVVSGFILPRLILSYFGSEMNGLVSAITQYLSIITFLDMGVGAVVQSSLFKPLADNDNVRISLIIKSASNFFKKIAYILIVYILILIIILPNVIETNISTLTTILLIISMSINFFSQYYFGIVNELLLNADQKSYIQLISELITVGINIVISVLLIINGFSIVAVKLSTSLIYLLRPLYLKYYVNKNYDIDYNITITEEPLEQKWNGMAQHVAAIVLSSMDVVILSLFTDLGTVSVYSVHNMVVNGISMIVSSLITGLKAFFGNLLASDELELLDEYFSKIEWLVHSIIIYLFGLTAVLITPFVMLYTTGIQDVNYYSPYFALILVLAKLVHSLRLPYNSLILAAGHFRETQTSAIIEVLINIVISLISITKFGIIGVATGTFIALAYRLVYFVVYLSKNILNRPLKKFIKLIFSDGLVFSIFLITSRFISYTVSSFTEWIIFALILAVLFLIIQIIMNLLFYPNYIKYFLKKVLKK